LKLTIGQKVLLGYGLAVLCMAVIGNAAYHGTERLLENANRGSDTDRAIRDGERLLGWLADAESASRGYVLTGEERYLEGYADSRRFIVETRKALEEDTADNPAQQRRLESIDRVLDKKLAFIQTSVDLRREKGFEASLQLLQTGTNRELMVEIRKMVEAMLSEEQRFLGERDRAARTSAQNNIRVVLYGSLFAFVAIALIGVGIQRSIAHPLAEFQKFVTAVGEGDLTQRSARDGGDELGKLAHGLNQMVTRLKNMATQTRAVTESLNSAAVDILASAREQSAVTGEQVATYQETNATMQEVSKSCSQMAEKAKEITVTAEAVSIANTSGLDAVEKTNQTVEAIHEQAEAVAQNIVSLSEKTQMVGDILATVNDIAEQSHLLALNAAIEAAAAGEHGRSFSVVAGEIKNLADQSKAATVQVKTILGDIQKEINTSVMLTEEAVKRVDLGKHQADMAALAIRDMAANIDQSVQAFQQIVAGTNQQQIGFDNVMRAMKDLSRASEQAATGNRQTEKAAANLTGLGIQLRTATEGYRL